MCIIEWIEWNRIESLNGMEWIGMLYGMNDECNGMEWNDGMEWNGLMN